ncbi:MAG: hypothetical protein ACK5DE_09990 [Bacteroidota bacterium]|jgi:hypothetical protein
MNQVLELEHRLAMVAEDIKAIREFINGMGLTQEFKNETLHADECWTHINNIEIACDLNSPESLTWTKFRS